MANLTLRLMLGGLLLAGRKKGLRDLFRLTAEAFGQAPPDLRGLSPDEILLKYAHFTRTEAERSLAGATAQTLRESLRERCQGLGRDLRSRLPIRSRADAAAALRALYRLLAIDLAVDARGEVTVRRCSLAAQYTPEVCGFMSAMDEGIVAGLSDGRLVFSRRLTEGADRCLARIDWDGENE
ncbi:MAG: hypothetical protein MUC72_11380 [Acidobacteria bacterium]|jgi:hypothetical protein|nr:hypothetical protein [Acidobacteriota bacterium]